MYSKRMVICQSKQRTSQTIPTNSQTPPSPEPSKRLELIIGALEYFLTLAWVAQARMQCILYDPQYRFAFQYKLYNLCGLLFLLLEQRPKTWKYLSQTSVTGNKYVPTSHSSCREILRRQQVADFLLSSRDTTQTHGKNSWLLDPSGGRLINTPTSRPGPLSTSSQTGSQIANE